MDGLSKDTVWNHRGMKYMMQKLQTDTKKLLKHTRKGTFFVNREGGSKGSGAI